MGGLVSLQRMGRSDADGPFQRVNSNTSEHQRQFERIVGRHACVLVGDRYGVRARGPCCFVIR
jgi:hypothetical protein